MRRLGRCCGRRNHPVSAAPVLVAKDCVVADRTLAVLIEYLDRHTAEELVGQTAVINTALIPLLLAAVPFHLTIDWIELGRKSKWQHG
jgi:hypothetical protein